MDERLTEEGIEHLQSAARELISAARVFLDVVEDLVEEPERITNTLSGVVEVFKDITARPVQPWEAHAWGDAASTGNDATSKRRSRRGGNGTDGVDDGRPRRGARPEEPRLFQTDDGTDGTDDDASDWAVWDEDEPGDEAETNSAVVDIRRATVKRITVD